MKRTHNSDGEQNTSENARMRFGTAGRKSTFVGCENVTPKHIDSPCGVEKGDVCLIKDDNKDRNKWELGIVEEHIVGRDGVVRAVKLRAGESYLERAVQQLYSFELSCVKSTEAENPPLNPEALAFRPRRDAAVAARLRVQEIAVRDQDD